MKIDDNVSVSVDGTTRCTHCSHVLGAVQTDPLGNALRRVQPAAEAGPGMRADPALFTDRMVVLRQLFCPECLALLATEIVPADEATFRTWTLSNGRGSNKQGP